MVIGLSLCSMDQNWRKSREVKRKVQEMNSFVLSAGFRSAHHRLGTVSGQLQNFSALYGAGDPVHSH